MKKMNLAKLELESFVTNIPNQSKARIYTGQRDVPTFFGPNCPPPTELAAMPVGVDTSM